MSARMVNGVLTREQAAALIERVIKLSRADEVQVSLDAGTEKNVRFADNRITTAGSNNESSTAMIAITTSSSTSVKPPRVLYRRTAHSSLRTPRRRRVRTGKRG